VLVLGEGRLLADTTPLALLHDESALAAAGLRVPALLAWLRGTGVDGVALRRVLRGLDAHALPVDAGAAAVQEVPA